MSYENEIRNLKEIITNLIYLLKRSRKIPKEVRERVIFGLKLKYYLLDSEYYNSVETELDRGIKLTKELLEKMKDDPNRRLVEVLGIVLAELEGDKEEIEKDVKSNS